MGNLSTPKSVQKLQTALHAKAEAEAGYRFYVLYDKISREDILAHAYAQCRSNKGAPGVDGQDFADIEAYGVERWLGELALALRQESYRPDPIRRVYIPKANGKLCQAPQGEAVGSRGESPVTPLTVRDKVVEVLQAAGATEEMVAAAVGAAGEFGDSPPRPNIEIQVAALLEEAADRLDVS